VVNLQKSMHSIVTRRFSTQVFPKHSCILFVFKIPKLVKTDRVVLKNAELFPFEEQSLEAVVSSLSLQWVNDLPGIYILIQPLLLGIEFSALKKVF
jgi:hypothetical protein